MRYRLAGINTSQYFYALGDCETKPVGRIDSRRFERVIYIAEDRSRANEQSYFLLSTLKRLRNEVDVHVICTTEKRASILIYQRNT